MERTSKLLNVKYFKASTAIKIVNNNTNDKQTSDASLALDEDSPYTNS